MNNKINYLGGKNKINLFGGGRKIGKRNPNVNGN